MGIFKLFKTEGEKRAYAKGRRDQYNKEHPMLRYGVQKRITEYNADGSIKERYNDVIFERDMHRSYKAACKAKQDADRSYKVTNDIARNALRSRSLGKLEYYERKLVDTSVVKLDKPVRKK